jgi:hypothetical protein
MQLNASEKQSSYTVPEAAINVQNQAEAQQEARMLDMINKIQLFQIAGDKVNNQLLLRKKEPVFNLTVQGKV